MEISMLVVVGRSELYQYVRIVQGIFASNPKWLLCWEIFSFSFLVQLQSLSAPMEIFMLFSCGIYDKVW